MSAEPGAGPTRAELLAQISELVRALEQERAARQASERFAIGALDFQQHQLVRVLHDTSAQSLNAARIQARVTRNTTQRLCPEASASAATLEAVIQGASEELRGLIRWLTPMLLGGSDVVARLTELAELASQTLPCMFRAKTQIHAEPEVQAELLRIAQLTLYDLVRGSSARAIAVELELDERGLLLTTRAIGARSVPRELEELLDRRARILGGSFTRQQAAEHDFTLACRLPTELSS